MNSIIKSYKSIPFGEDLRYCPQEGIIYQFDMSKKFSYDRAYYNHYKRLENTEIAKKLNRHRFNLTHKYCSRGVFDIGVGSGTFLEWCSLPGYGYDINPEGINWLKQHGIYLEPKDAKGKWIDGWTFWDSLEHMRDPGEVLQYIEPGQYVFVSLPIFVDIFDLRQSKHYKPDEHYYYFTAGGFLRYMEDSGFSLVEISDGEIKAGRDSIGAFVLKRCG